MPGLHQRRGHVHVCPKCGDTVDLHPSWPRVECSNGHIENNTRNVMAREMWDAGENLATIAGTLNCRVFDLSPWLYDVFGLVCRIRKGTDVAVVRKAREPKPGDLPPVDELVDTDEFVITAADKRREQDHDDLRAVGCALSRHWSKAGRASEDEADAARGALTRLRARLLGGNGG